MDTFQVTVLILQYNGFSLTKRLLQSIQKYDELEKHRFIIADNNSTETDGFEWFKIKFPQIKLIKNMENYGFAKGINRLFDHVKTPYFLLLNNDIVLENSAISETLACLQLYQGDAATCIMYEEDGRLMHNSSYALTPLERIFKNATGISKLKRFLHQRFQPRTHQVAYINGGFLLIRSELFARVKGFHEYFMYTEDLDLMLKFRKQNATLLFCPNGKVIHADGSTTRKIWTNHRKMEVQIKQSIDCHKRHYKGISFLQ